MNWRGHVLFALLLTFALSLVCSSLYLMSLMEWLWALPVIIFASLLPDVDIESSKSQRMANFLALVFAIAYGFHDIGQYLAYGWKLSLEILGAYFLVVYVFKPKHRGITHSLLAAGLFGGITAVVFGKIIGCLGLAAYISHLIADSHIKIK